jgi:hypothetical protein
MLERERTQSQARDMLEVGKLENTRKKSDVKI